jgi:hypothetical protein
MYQRFAGCQEFLMYTSLPEQPQGIWDLTGLGFRFWRRNMGPILRFLLMPSILVTILSVSFQWVLSYGVTAVTHSKDLATGLALFGAFTLDFFLWLLAWWWLGLRLMALVRLSLGFASGLEEAQAHMMQRKWSVAGLYTSLLVAVLGISMFWLVVMVSGMVFTGAARGIAMLVTLNIGGWGLLITIVLYILISNLGYCLMACEDLTVWAALSKSMAILSKHFWRTLGFGLAFLLVFSVVSMPMSLPVAALTILDYVQHGVFSGDPAAASAYNPPLHLMIITTSWESLMGMLLRPLTVCAWGYFYYDLRMRTEGLDLKRRLAEIDKPVSDAWPSR